MRPTPTRRAFLGGMPALILASGCSSPNPSLYTLGPTPGTSRPGGPATVVLRQVAVARYLERPELVRSSEDFRLEVMANEAWGEPLPQMISRVLLEDLAQRLPGTTVLNASGAITVKEDATVEVNIQRMDRDASGALAFVAQASVSHAGSSRPFTRTVRTSIPLASTTTADEVRAMSVALGKLADEIAGMLLQSAAPVPRRR